MEKILMTTSSLKKMEDELHKLKGVEMREKLKNLSDAKDKGDISENAEYEITADFIKSTKQSNTILNDCIAVFKKTGNKYESFGIYYKSCTETEIPIWYNGEQSLAYLQAKINNLINGIL